MLGMKAIQPTTAIPTSKAQQLCQRLLQQHHLGVLTDRSHWVGKTTQVVKRRRRRSDTLTSNKQSTSKTYQNMLIRCCTPAILQFILQSCFSIVSTFSQDHVGHGPLLVTPSYHCLPNNRNASVPSRLCCFCVVFYCVLLHLLKVLKRFAK